MKLDHVPTAFYSLYERPHDSARRSFLFGSLGILALAPFEYARAVMRSPVPRSAFEALLDTLGNQSSVQQLGKIFLTSDEGRIFDRQDCLERLSREVENHASVHKHLLQLISTDFVLRRTVQLEGWILSRSEVELCALCVQ